jgi:hypothetical protein
MKEYLTEIEISKIEQFCADEAMFEAVRKVMLAGVYYSGALKKGDKLEPKNQAFDMLATAYKTGKQVSNESLGEELRGLFSGVDMVEQGFGNLKTIKSEEKKVVESPFNIAE